MNRLKRDLQFLDRQVLAAQHQSRDCDLPQTTRGVDREASYLPYAGVDDEESAPIGTTATAGSTLKGSMMEDDDTD